MVAQWLRKAVAAVVVCFVVVVAAVSAAQAVTVPTGDQQNQSTMPAYQGQWTKAAVALEAAEAADVEAQQPAVAEEDVIEGAAEKTLDACGRPTQVITKLYDSKGKYIGYRSETIAYDDKGRIVNQTIERYDDKKTKISTTCLNYTRTFDDKGKVLTTTITLSKNGELINTSEHTFTYNDKGRVAQRDAVFKDAKGNVIRTVVQTNAFNAKGQVSVMTIVRKDGSGKLLETQFIHNTYDDKTGKLSQQNSIIRDSANVMRRSSVVIYKDGVAKSGITKYFDKSGNLQRREVSRYK